jgi:urease beta subunit
VILNKNIPINQQTGYISQSSKNGNDNKSEPTQIFSHHHLSAKNPQKAFHRAKQTTKLIEINTHVFQL